MSCLLKLNSLWYDVVLIKLPIFLMLIKSWILSTLLGESLIHHCICIKYILHLSLVNLENFSRKTVKISLSFGIVPVIKSGLFTTYLTKKQKSSTSLWSTLTNCHRTSAEKMNVTPFSILGKYLFRHQMTKDKIFLNY